MPFVAANPNARLGEVVGHCLPHVQRTAGVPHSSRMRKGEHVLSAGNDLPKGIAIATFDPDGKYGNHVDGRSHAAVLLERVPEGLRVIDCWVGRPVGERIIRDKRGVGPAADDASKYYVIEAVG